MKKYKYKYLVIILALVLILSSSISAVALSATKFNTLTADGILYTTKESEISLSSSISEDVLSGIQLTDNKGNIIATKFEINKNKIIIKPLKDLTPNKKYDIKLFTLDKKKFQLSLTAQNEVLIDDNKDSFIKISANPEKGFNYPYYLLVPKGTQTETNKKYMVVEPNNTGFPTNSMEAHEIGVKIHLHNYNTWTGGAGGRQVATELKTPLLIPVFPRPTTEDGAGVYVQALDREAITHKGVKYERPDLQLKAMIEDAQNLLANEGIKLEKKVFMVGFSASGDFVNRFMFLHPGMVKAIASSTSSIFPASKYKGVTLNYPLGTADMEKLFGIKFNAKEYEKIAKYIYMGDQDGNDFTQEWDKNGQAYVKAIHTLFKNETQPYKWNRKIEILDDLGYGNNYQHHIYKDIGHSISYNMHEDIVEFFRVNTGSKFTKITPHEYGN